MKQPYFIVVLAHSIHGRIRRIQIPHHAVYLVLALALVGCFSLFGFVSSYARMVWKVANYNALRNEVDSLRARYANLQSSADETKSQLATLQMFASEVSLAYGIKQKLEGPAEISGEGRLVPTYNETLSEYYFLKGASLSRAYRHGSGLWRHTDTRPNLWPVMGRLLGGFGTRNDPFSGEPSFHTGVDISAPYGTEIKAVARGRVDYASWLAGLGNCIILNHGGGYYTLYAHAAEVFVKVGQEVPAGQVIAKVGDSESLRGNCLHFEVRKGKQALNPEQWLR